MNNQKLFNALRLDLNYHLWHQMQFYFNYQDHIRLYEQLIIQMRSQLESELELQLYRKMLTK